MVYSRNTPKCPYPVRAGTLQAHAHVANSTDWQSLYRGGGAGGNLPGESPLEKILRDKGIKTVIIAGTTAEGAVVHTATGASMRVLNVIVSVDGMSAGTLYAEQYTAWHLTNAPGTRRSTTLTKFDMIDF